MSIPINEKNEKQILRILFKRLHIVLHSRFDEKYPQMDYDEEIRYEDFHDLKEE